MPDTMKHLVSLFHICLQAKVLSCFSGVKGPTSRLKLSSGDIFEKLRGIYARLEVGTYLKQRYIIRPFSWKKKDAATENNISSF